MELYQIQTALTSNDEAFVELIEEKKDKLIRIAYRYCLNETMVEDVISETIYQAYRNRRKCKHPEYFDTWIIRILINNCYSEIKKNQTYSELTIDIQDTHVSDHVLRAMVYDLKEPERSILILHYFEGYSFKEIASILELPENTVKTKTYRILKELQLEMKGVIS